MAVYDSKKDYTKAGGPKKTDSQAERVKKNREKVAKEGAEAKKRKRLKKAYKKEAGLKWYQKAPKEMKEKAAKKSKAKETGKVRKGAKGVKSTKGGEYVKYGKKSEAAKDFRSAFKAAKGKDFEWDGRKYSGKKAEEGGKVESYKGGGKVESSGGKSNPYGWPTRDSSDHS